jgi:hypothetical protein
MEVAMIRIISCVRFSLLSIGLGVLAGCSHDNNPTVPMGAMQVSSGGKVVAFTAPHDGRAYVRDDNDKHVIYSADVKKDQVVKFDPQEKAVMIDGRVAAEKIADPDHDHSIFFERSAQPDRADAANANNGNPTVPVVRVPVGVQVDVQTQPAPHQQ